MTIQAEMLPLAVLPREIQSEQAKVITFNTKRVLIRYTCFQAHPHKHQMVLVNYLTSADYVSVLGQQVHHLPFPFIAPLSPEHHGHSVAHIWCWHPARRLLAVGSSSVLRLYIPAV